jgi:hypothetical protein
VYWDVVEVIPEPDYCLFVRFRDGMSGRVRLQREELTGALGPLLDMDFFRRVYMIPARSHGPAISTWRQTLCTPTWHKEQGEQRQAS